MGRAEHHDKVAESFRSEPSAETGPASLVRRRFLVNGIVQGVGFRPFVYVTAVNLGVFAGMAISAGTLDYNAEDLEFVVAGDVVVSGGTLKCLYNEPLPSTVYGKLRV